MAARGGTIITEQVSQAQIDALGERMDKGFNELKDLLRAYEERIRGLENREAGCSPLINSRLNAAWARIDVHDTQLGQLREALQQMATTVGFLKTISDRIEAHDTQLGQLREALQQMAKTAGFLEKIAKWLLGIITTVGVALLIAFLTGKIDIVFR